MVKKPYTWDEIKEYPESFLWKNCDYWKELSDLIKSYTILFYHIFIIPKKISSKNYSHFNYTTFS